MVTLLRLIMWSFDEYYNEFNKNLEENISEENSISDESFYLSNEDYSNESKDGERDILNSS